MHDHETVLTFISQFCPIFVMFLILDLLEIRKRDHDHSDYKFNDLLMILNRDSFDMNSYYLLQWRQKGGRGYRNSKNFF